MIKPRAVRRRRPTAGFTLVELMVAIVVLSVGMLGLAMVLMSSMRSLRLASSRSEATAIAESKLEELRSYSMTAGSDTLQARLALGGSVTARTVLYSDYAQSPGGSWYDRRWHITPGPAGTRRVTLRVEPTVALPYTVKRLEFTTLVALR